MLHVQTYLEQFILPLWIPELFMTFVLMVLIFTMAFWKDKSKLVFIKMITYAYVLILFLYQHTYRNIELGLRVTAHPLPGAPDSKPWHWVSESLWNNYNLGFIPIKMIVICVFLILFLLLIDFLNMRGSLQGNMSLPLFSIFKYCFIFEYYRFSLYVSFFGIIEFNFICFDMC